MLTGRAQPELRRVFNPFEGAVVQGRGERRTENAAAVPNWREALIRAQRKVIDHYRELLAAHDMPQAERTSIENRVAIIEKEIADLQESPTVSGSPHFNRPHELTQIE